MRTLAALGLFAAVLAQPALAQASRDNPSAGAGNAEQTNKPTTNQGSGGGAASSN